MLFLTLNNKIYFKKSVIIDCFKDLNELLLNFLIEECSLYKTNDLTIQKMFYSLNMLFLTLNNEIY